MAASAPADPLEPPPTYVVRRATGAPPPVSGALVGHAWESAEWTRPFVDIRGEATGPAPPPGVDTRAKLLWDDHYLYVGAHLSATHVWATITRDNDVMFHDNDFEVFLDPDGAARNYYELEINAAGAAWQLSLSAPYHAGGAATSPDELRGLRRGVAVLGGALNDAAGACDGWSVALALPFAQLARFGARAPRPRVGDVWRANMSRVHWQHEVVDGRLRRVPPHGTPLPQGEHEHHPERNLVWAPTGVVDVHRPHRWGFLRFAE